MTTVEPIDELLLQKRLECQEKLNKTNESFEPGKQFMVLCVWDSIQLNTIHVHNFRQQTAQHNHASENERTHTKRRMLKIDFQE